MKKLRLAYEEIETHEGRNETIRLEFLNESQTSLGQHVL